MKIDDKTVEYVAALAKLELSGEEGLTRERARTDLERILAYMETMNELDTEGIEPMSHVLPLKNVFREDVVQVADRKYDAEQAEATVKEKHQMESVETTERMGQTEPAEIRGRNRERLLSNAPLQKDGCFVVPKTVE